LTSSVWPRSFATEYWLNSLRRPSGAAEADIRSQTTIAGTLRTHYDDGGISIQAIGRLLKFLFSELQLASEAGLMVVCFGRWWS
jgi:hypothetical protein